MASSVNSSQSESPCCWYSFTWASSLASWRLVTSSWMRDQGSICSLLLGKNWFLHSIESLEMTVHFPVSSHLRYHRAIGFFHNLVERIDYICWTLWSELCEHYHHLLHNNICFPTPPPSTQMLYYLFLLYPSCTLSVPYCTPPVPPLYPYCTPSVPLLYLSCTPSIPLLYPLCTPPVPALHPSCTPLYPSCTPLYPSCTPLYPSCTPSVHFLYPLCTLFWIREGGTLCPRWLQRMITFKRFDE